MDITQVKIFPVEEEKLKAFVSVIFDDCFVVSDIKIIPSEGHDTAFTLLEGVERNAIIQMLRETGGNKLETAKRLGIGRQTLYNKIKAYGIET